MREKIFASIVLVLLIFKLPAFSQKIEVVEKSITKKIPFNSTETLNLLAEKADVNIVGGVGQDVLIKITFSAAASNKIDATTELSYMKYAVAKNGKKLEISNTYIIPGNISKLKSQLKTKIEITIPADCKIFVTNNYGDIEISNVHGSFKLQNEFGNIRMNHLVGEVNVQGSFSEIIGSDLKGTINCTSDKSQINFSTL